MQQVDVLKAQIGNLESRLEEAEKRPGIGFPADRDSGVTKGRASK